MAIGRGSFNLVHPPLLSLRIVNSFMTVLKNTSISGRYRQLWTLLLAVIFLSIAGCYNKHVIQ
jgi:hypothetical protein